MSINTFNKGLDDACLGEEPNQELYNNDFDYASAYNHYSRNDYPEPDYPKPKYPEPEEELIKKGAAHEIRRR